MLSMGYLDGEPTNIRIVPGTVEVFFFLGFFVLWENDSLGVFGALVPPKGELAQFEAEVGEKERPLR